MAFNPLAKLTGTKLRVCIFIASTIGFVLFGYDNGVFSGLIVNVCILAQMVETPPHHPDLLVALVSQHLQRPRTQTSRNS